MTTVFKLFEESGDGREFWLSEEQFGCSAPSRIVDEQTCFIGAHAAG